MTRLRRVRKWILATLALLVLLPLLLIIAAVLILRTETGTAWLIEQIPGLEVTAGQGSVLSQWQADSLRWQGYGVGVRVGAPVVAWSPGCLFGKQVCLDTLHAGSVEVTVQPAGTEDRGASQGIGLPDINLPLAARIGDLSVGPFMFNGTPVWDELHLAADGSGADWTFHDLTYQLGEISVSLSGQLATKRDWPLSLTLDASLPPPSGDRWQVRADLGGSVHDLRIDAVSEGYLTADLEGEVHPLDPNIPLKLQMTAPRFLPHDSVPDILMLTEWRLEASGDLEGGLVTRSSATLPGTSQAIAAELRGLLTLAGVNDLELTMVPVAAAGEGKASGKLKLTGDAGWDGRIWARTAIAMDAFPWYSLVPGLPQLPVTVQSLDGTLTYDGGTYQAELAAGVTGPMGATQVSSALRGDLESLNLSGLSIRSGAGELTGDAKLSFADGVAWQAGLVLDEFDPGYWVPLLQASLSGNVTTQGRMGASGRPELMAAWGLSGSWRDQPTTLQGRVEAVNGDWLFQDLNMTVADNRLVGQGRWGDQVSASVQLNLPSPQLVLAELTGTLQGDVKLAGTPANPTGQARFQGRNLSWQGTASVGRVELSADLAAGLSVDARLGAQGLEAGGQILDALELAFTGSPEDHRLRITATHPEVQASLDFQGRLPDHWRGWNGVLANGQIALLSQGQTWRLSSPADLDLRLKPEVPLTQADLTLAAHCWTWQDSSLCAADQTLLPEPRLAYRINDFPAQALAPLLPDSLRWNSAISGEFQLAMKPEGPDGKLWLSAAEGVIELLVEGDWQALDYHRLETRVTLEPSLARLELELAGAKIGELSMSVNVDPNSEQRNLDGRFRLAGLDLSLVNTFVPLEQVEGRVSGEGRLSGPLMNPAVTGELVLSEGRVVDPRIPVPFQDVLLVLELRGREAAISGRWQSNERSSGTLKGRFSWQESPEAELHISGKRLPFRYEPYALLEMGPDLKIRFSGGDISVTGRIDVPRGKVEIRKLPEQAVSVSDDEIIVGVAKEQPAVRSLKMDVVVVVGSDEVTFEGFGVTGELKGTLRIGNDMDTRGALELADGRYEAYGQELELRKARLVFVGPVTQPYLDIEAVREVDSVTAGIRLTGPVSEPQTEIFSEPVMSQGEALSYVILGRPLRSEGDQGQVSRAALSLGLTQTSRLTQGIGEELGIQNLILEAEGSGEETSVVASGYITDELSLRYGVGVFSPITTIAIRYDLGRYFYLEAASGLAASLDIFYTRDF